MFKWLHSTEAKEKINIEFKASKLLTNDYYFFFSARFVAY